jgi:hypothetical protein
VAATEYLVVLSAGGELVAAVFPGAESRGRGEFVVRVADVSALNRGIGELIARGALLTGVAPARSALERQFREAVGEVA